jgi:hypothetical protein
MHEALLGSRWIWPRPLLMEYSIFLEFCFIENLIREKNAANRVRNQSYPNFSTNESEVKRNHSLTIVEIKHKLWGLSKILRLLCSENCKTLNSQCSMLRYLNTWSWFLGELFPMIVAYNSFSITEVVDSHFSVPIRSCVLTRSICDISINNIFQPIQLEFKPSTEIVRLILHSNEISWCFILEVREASR